MMKMSTDSSTFCPLNHLALHSKSIRKASTCPHGITIKVQIIGIKTSMPFMKVIRVSIDTPISNHILFNFDQKDQITDQITEIDA